MPPSMPGLQGYSLRLIMLQFVYECIGFHCLYSFLGLHPECSLSGSLSCAELWYLFCVRLCALTQSVMATVVRVEPCEMKLLDSNPELLAKVEAIGWLPFIRKFSNSNLEVTRVFAMSLVNFQVEVGDLRFRVDERSMALATGLSLAGERWFKYRRMDITEWWQLLKNPGQEVSFRSGVARRYFKKEWRPVLDLIHGYVTYEGRLSSAYVYHLRLMSAFIGFPMNLPY